MSEEPVGPRYSEKQAGAILKRAVERSAAAGAEGSSGITLAEMERMAAEIGIDPKHVRAAAAEVSGRSATGGPGVIDLEQKVAAELSEEAWDSIVAELRRAFGVAGTVSEVGRAREWDLPNLHASVVSRKGSTTVHLMNNHSSEISIAYVMWAIVSLFAAFIAAIAGVKQGGVDQALINALIGMAISGAGLLGIRISVNNWHRRQHARMEGLLQRVTGLIREHDPAAALVSEVEPQALPEARPVAAEAAQPVVIRGT